LNLYYTGKINEIENECKDSSIEMFFRLNALLPKPSRHAWYPAAPASDGFVPLDEVSLLHIWQFKKLKDVDIKSTVEVDMALLRSDLEKVLGDTSDKSITTRSHTKGNIITRFFGHQLFKEYKLISQLEEYANGNLDRSKLRILFHFYLFLTHTVYC